MKFKTFICINVKFISSNVCSILFFQIFNAIWLINCLIDNNIVRWSKSTVENKIKITLTCYKIIRENIDEIVSRLEALQVDTAGTATRPQRQMNFDRTTVVRLPHGCRTIVEFWNFDSTFVTTLQWCVYHCVSYTCVIECIIYEILKIFRFM